MSDIIVNIDKAEKEDILEEIINAQYALIKTLQDAVDKLYGENVVRIERAKDKKQVRTEVTQSTKEG